jgi:1,4-alpha-glucan branching enzyme
MPDPQAESTFLSAKLQWKELEEPNHAAQVDWYGRILKVRRQHILPLLDGRADRRGSCRVQGPGRLACEWELRDGRWLRLAANLCATASDGFAPAAECGPIWLEGAQPDAQTLGAWTVRWLVG